MAEQGLEAVSEAPALWDSTGGEDSFIPVILVAFPGQNLPTAPEPAAWGGWGSLGSLAPPQHT